jgi:hypothetical protein
MSAREQANALKAQGSKPIHKTFMAISLGLQTTSAPPRLSLPAAASIVPERRRIKYVPCRIEAANRQLDIFAFTRGLLFELWFIEWELEELCCSRQDDHSS